MFYTKFAVGSSFIGEILKFQVWRARKVGFRQGTFRLTTSNVATALSLATSTVVDVSSGIAGSDGIYKVVSAPKETRHCGDTPDEGYEGPKEPRAAQCHWQPSLYELRLTKYVTKELEPVSSPIYRSPHLFFLSCVYSLFTPCLEVELPCVLLSSLLRCACIEVSTRLREFLRQTCFDQI